MRLIGFLALAALGFATPGRAQDAPLPERGRYLVEVTAALGAWSDAEIDRAIRAGVSCDGARLNPPMAYDAHARLSAGDMADLIAYLRSLPPR